MGGKSKTNTSSNRVTPPKSKLQSRGKKYKKETTDLKDGKININWDSKHFGYILLVCSLALASGILHSSHISVMFENERFFSHLSTLERELSFRTEMGLYYSYYKTIVEAPTFMDGLNSITACNITEYPNQVNVLRRFNLYPEVALGLAYRIYDWISTTYNIRTKDCYTVNRGYGLSPVESCEGMGDIAFFYVYPIFWLNGAMMSLVFMMGFYLSESIFGGILSVAAFFFNHGEATRIMWTPPLRESFSFPFLIAQLLCVVFIIKTHKPIWKHSLMLCFVTLCFMLPWQFAQFALLTQICALFGLYVLKFITSGKVLCIVYGLLAAHALNFLLQFANTLLMSSFFVSATLMTLVLAKSEPLINKLPNRIIIWIVQGLTFICGTFASKIGIAKLFNIKDDAHIFDILKSKFSNYKDFHTLLYVCAPEFDFYEAETPIRLTKTLLIPCALLSTILLLIKVFQNETKFWFGSNVFKESKEGDQTKAPQDQSTIEDLTKPYAAHLYFLLQTIAFVLMSILIMRLKLFGTPALCIMTSLLASRQLLGFIKNPLHHQALIVVLLATMSVQGILNLKSQFNTKGEYNNPELEQLVEWIQHKTPSDAVFAGSMPTMATIKLTTKRAIVNHPHYEDAGLRERTRKIYQIYSRQSCNHVHRALKELRVTHMILEDSWCVKRYKPGCSLPEIWDIEDPANKGKTPCCTILQLNAQPFSELFRNKQYLVLKV